MDTQKIVALLLALVLIIASLGTIIFKFAHPEVMPTETSQIAWKEILLVITGGLVLLLGISSKDKDKD